VGRAHSNLILNTRTYEFEFIDGQKAELAANVIAQNMFAQCDSKGKTYSYPASSITDKMILHQLKQKTDIYIRHGSNLQPRKTTNGWSLCVKRKDGSTS
jgi:hypothetical protein